MRKYIYFIRHGECLSNVNSQFNGPEDVLSDNGLKQAVLVAERFKHITVDKIYHSGILRAQITAGEIEKVTGIKSESKDFLKERQGTFSHNGVYKYIEDFESLKNRLTEIKSFLENNESRHIVIISHAILLKSLAAYFILNNLIDENLIKSFDDVLVMDNTGVSKFMFNSEKKKWRIMFWNDLNHLA